MDGKRAATLVAAVFVMVGFVGIASPPAPAAEPLSKASTALQKLPTAVLEAVQGTGEPAGLLADRRVRTDASGRIQLDFHAARATGSAEEADLARLGADGIRGLALSPELNVTTGMIEAWLPGDAVIAAAGLPWVTSVTLPAYGHTSAVTGAGVALHKANLAQAKGLTGAGVTVGVVSDGVLNLAASQAAGELPEVTVVDPLTFGPGTGDEGTAMLEIVHEMAPQAKLAFHAAGIGDVVTPLTLVIAFEALRQAGANVIVHDVGFLDEPVFQSGVVAQVIDGITSLGVSVHAPAGNSGDTHTARVQATGSGTGPEGQAGPFPNCGPFPPTNAVGIGPGGRTSFEVTLYPGVEAAFVLQWSEPRSIFPTAGQGGFTDLDLFLMTPDLSDCVDVSADLQANGTGDTLEAIVGMSTDPAPVNAKLVVSSFVDPGAETPAGVPTLDLRWDGAEAVDPPTRAGSMDPVANYTTELPAAVAAVDPATGQIEPYSSGGPIELFTTTNCPPGTVKNVDEECPASPGTSVGTFPGPAWTAADNVEVSGAGGFGSPFRGTSASAPHSGACDALVRQAIGQPDSPVAPVHERLVSTAVDVEAAGPDTVAGAGILDCLAASAVSDIALSNGVSATEPAPGEGLVFTLTAADDGPDAGTRLALTAGLPEGLTFASSESGCTADGQALSCPLTDLAPAERRSFTFEATVDTAVESGTELVTTATVTSPFDVSLADNTASAKVIVVVPPPVDQLAATGSSGWSVLPVGLVLLGTAMGGLTLARRSQVASRR